MEVTESGLLVTKNKSIVQESACGVCLWEMPSGGYISDGDGYLSMEGRLNDPRIEAKMRDAAQYWTGHIYGKAVWFSGYRKVTDDEYEDQMDRLLAGQIPDPHDEARQIKQREQ